jgi:hypothetical protein
MRSVVLEPGESRTFESHLNSPQRHRLGQGEFKVYVVYYAKQKMLVKDASEDLKTNTVTITVGK